SSTSNINTIKSSDCPDSDKGMHYETNCADRIKLVYFDGTGVCLFAKRLEDGKFCWPGVTDGVVRLTAAQLQALLEGLDWRRVHETRETRVPIAAS
ncbi:IS66 family insertion sequence element accessory protein TnpB, partial [Mesorhizobium sp. M1295]|uniref:IS66 family insertion sequence element accessory protein TnpB n=1 Tax=Mesorhizobium sp. M1295 TaxID=2957076 RepID=UPI00333ABE32